MSTAVTDKKPTGQLSTNVVEERSVTYVPIGEKEELVLTVGQVEKFLCVKTRTGKIACREDITKFMMLCKAQGLNPWVNDAYLVGYDTNDGPKFQLISAHQALLKRAELSSDYDGMASGVCVLSKDGDIIERQGDLVLPNERLVGGWARVHRRDRSVPSYDALKLETFSTGKSRWSADPAGMIVKCAEASALRKAFPSTLAQMFCKEEMERQIEFGVDRHQRIESTNHTAPASKSEAIANVLMSRISTGKSEPERDSTIETTATKSTEDTQSQRVSHLDECRTAVEKAGFETASKNPEGTIIAATLDDGKQILLCEIDAGPNPTGDHIVDVFEADAVQVTNNIIEAAKKPKR